MLTAFAPPILFPKMTSVAFFASATDADASTDTLALPSGIRTGDVVILAARDQNSGSPAPSAAVPSGYTLINSFVISFGRMIFSYRVLDGTETVIPTYSNGKTSTRRIALVFRPAAPLEAITPAGFQSQATDGNPSPQVISSGSGAVPLVAFGFYINSNGSTVDPRTASPAFDAEVSHAPWMWFNYKVYNTSPADITVNMDDEGILNGLASFYVQFA
jgi:hypothetical protein